MGATAEYCLSADGYGITVAGGTSNTASFYDWNVVHGGGYDYQTTIGSSFAAPLSGAIALLANHFPNHTPEQLTDRLLATAYNDWAVEVDGTTTLQWVVML